MPLYEYKCLSCDNVSEVIQRMDDAPLSTCDECGGELKKLLSAPSFQFKGSGWYVTDYAKSGSNGKEGSDAGDSKAKSDSKSEAKSDSKSESKSDSGDAGKSEKKASPKTSEPERKTKSERISSD